MDTDDLEELSQGGADKQPAKTLEQRMAELGLHHIGESAEDVRRRLGLEAKLETREAEIKRLNEGMVAAGKRISELEVANAALTEENDRLVAEVAQLRAELRRYEPSDAVMFQLQARDDAIRYVYDLLDNMMGSDDMPDVQDWMSWPVVAAACTEKGG
jgi:hypothetical protein